MKRYVKVYAKEIGGIGQWSLFVQRRAKVLSCFKLITNRCLVFLI
jgi:hypothetical protein